MKEINVAHDKSRLFMANVFCSSYVHSMVLRTSQAEPVDLYRNTKNEDM